MKKTLLTGILAAVLLGSTTLATQAQTLNVDRTKYPDYTDKVNPDWSLMAPAHDAKAAGMKRAAATQRPDHVNNAATRHFPPVFNQDGGSCGSASRISYMFSYELAAYRNLDGSKPENYYPSHFVWLHTYSPTTPIDQGKDAFVMHVGVPSAATYGGQTYSSLFGYQEASNEDFGWMQGYDKWYEAMHNRMLKPSHFPMSIETEEGREAVKRWLWNHNGDDDFAAGGICGVGVASGGVWKKIPKTEANDKAGVTDMYYVYEWGTQVDHALTIVGYDDRIEFDLDKDGIYGEAEADERGAWIIVNSWGDWCNGGFIYCPYAFAGSAFKNDGGAGSRTFNGDFWWPEIYRVRKDYRPLRTIKLEMDYSRRSEIALSAGISADINATAPEKTVSFVHFTYAGDGASGNTNPAPEIPMLGRWADGKLHTEPMEFGYDLTDLTDGYDMNKPLKYFFIIDTKSWAKGEGTIYNASIIDYRYDELGIETPFGVGEGVEIKNAGDKTIISVVVQGGGYHAPQNVAYTDGTISWQAPLPSASTIKNYRVYADGKLIAEPAANTTSYKTKEADNASVYAVSAIYADGNESTTATVQTPVKPSSPNTGVQFAQAGFTIPGVFGTKYEQATIEYWIKPTTITNWNQSGGPGWGQFMFHFNANGTITAGWDTANRFNTTAVVKTGQWTHVAIVVDKNTMMVYLNGINRGTFRSGAYSGIGGFGDLVFASNGAQNAQDAVYDEIRIWNTARSAAEIKEYMNAEFTGNIMPKALVAYLKGDLITDSEGNQLMRDCAGGHHATLSGTGCTAVDANMPALKAPTTAPTVSIDKPTGTLYAGIPVTLAATVNDATNQLAWTAEAAGVKDIAVENPSITFPKAGTHTVTVTAATAGGQKATASIDLDVKAAPAPDATFTMTTGNIPAGQRVTFLTKNPQLGYTYKWEMPGADVPQATSVNAAATYQTQGRYKVTLTVTAPDGTKQSSTQQINVIEVAPKAAFDITPGAITMGEEVTLTDRSAYAPTYWKWHLTNGSNNYIVYAKDTTFTIDKPGTYDVTLEVANNKGIDRITRNRALVVACADSKNGLTFGYDAAKVTLTKVPLAQGKRNFTIEWWMNPAWPETFCNSIGDSDETFVIKTDAEGCMRLYIGGNNINSPSDYVVAGEWHHYAVTFNSGDVKFYRDGSWVGGGKASKNPTLPTLNGFAIGGSEAPFRGSIDEFRIWEKTLTVSQLRNYANAPIENVAEAGLVLYYNFNQNGGDVQDLTANANHGKRSGFGPDGDAWGLSKGVFSLNLSSAKGEDVTAKYLKNYQAPFSLDASKCVNPNLSTRTYAIKDWKTAGTITENNITTGAHVDKMKNSGFTITTGWDNFAATLTDHTAYQTITLPAGYYTFSTTYGDYEGQCGGSYLVATLGDTLSTSQDLSKALGYAAMKAKGNTTTNQVSFMFDEESTVSVGILANMSGNLCMVINSFALVKSEVTIIGTPRPVPDSIEHLTVESAPVLKGIYDLTGRQLREDAGDTDGLAPGLYIVGGRKVLLR